MDTNFDPNDPKQALNAAIALVGGIAVFAEKVGAPSVHAVKAWKLKQVPAEYCPDIERLTGGKVRCEHLRADVRWDFVRANPVEV